MDITLQNGWPRAVHGLVLVCRNAEKAARVKEELEDEHQTSVRILQADFSRLAEVRKTAAAILEDNPRIDVLINNAGIHNTRRTLTENGVETVFCVNHLASFLFTRLLLPRILESAPARIIQVNSQGHRFGGLDLNDLNWERRRYRGLQGYGASKVAQLLTVWELADRLQGTGVTINAMHPGAVRTNIGMNNGLLYQWYQRYLLWPLLKDPRISGESIYYLAAAPEMACGQRPLLQSDHRRKTRRACPGPGAWETGLAGQRRVDRSYGKMDKTGCCHLLAAVFWKERISYEI